MTNEELKEKIVDIVAMAILEADELPFVETAEYVADALIAAGIGDVKEVEAEANRYEMLYKMQSRDMVLAERKVHEAERKVHEAEHRAEVAEKAGRIIQRDMARVFDISNPRVCELIANIWDLAKKQAEKELTEEDEE